MRKTVVSFTIVFSLSFAQTAQANPFVWLAKFMGEYFLGKAIDEVWDAATGKPDVRELDRRLESFQLALGKVDANLTRSVAELRRELNDKVTKEQVRKIVEQALADLEKRVKELEIRVDRIDVRVKAIEEAFGFLPTVPPSPLLRTTVAEGNPEAHPLTVEWAKLLSRMETSRVNIELLLVDRTDENADVKSARTGDARLLTEISPLKQKVSTEFSRLFEEREELMKQGLRPTHRSIRLQDDKLASVMWLRGVTQPVKDGKNSGRLPVPRELVGPACSDILAAFDIAKADTRALVPLFRQLLVIEIQPVAGGTPLALTPEMERVVAKSRAVFESAATLRDGVRQTDAEIERTRKEFSENHEEMKKLRTKQRGLLDQIHKLHDDAEKLLTEGLELYVEMLKKGERPTNSRMLEFRKQVPKPLSELAAVTSCEDWTDPISKNDTWTKFRGEAVNFFAGTTNSIGMQFVSVPAGNFMMGSPDNETDRSKDEGPQHRVTIKAFRLGAHEVTQQQYEAVMGAGKNPSNFTTAKGGGPDNPVEQVSWDDAQEFCRKLEALPAEQAAGRKYRLPSEAEWEYACRAGNAAAYCFGANAKQLGEYAWFTENSSGKTHPVGTKKPNAFGLYDMHGNVWEWCADKWHDNYTGAPTDGSAWESSGLNHRVLRGGSWSVYPRNARSAYRVRLTPDNRLNDIGFRVVCISVGVRTP